MSDVMFYGVLRMPYELAMSDEFSRLQFYSRVQEAVDRLEKAESAARNPGAGRVVPIEPTQEMIAAAWLENCGRSNHDMLKRIYRAMLSAAPDAPQPASQAVMQQVQALTDSRLTLFNEVVEKHAQPAVQPAEPLTDAPTVSGAMSNNEKMRSDFEDWARRCCDATDGDMKRDKHGYVWIEWQRAFGAWQVATAKATLAERERCELIAAHNVSVINVLRQIRSGYDQ